MNKTIVCADGFRMTYLINRASGLFDVTYISRAEEELASYIKEGAFSVESFYPGVPSLKVMEIIEKHGGVEYEVKPLTKIAGE